MDLATLEEIRQVKYKYLRCVDTKLWDEIGDTFTQDATVDYGTKATGRPLRLAGRDEIVAWFRKNLPAEILTVHAAGQPEITIGEAGDTATGIWSFTDTVIVTAFNMVVAGAAFYHDQYRRDDDGRWRIAHTGYRRTYESTMSLEDLPSWKLIAQISDAD